MVSISSKKCIGCGACAAVAPKCFEMKGDKAVVKTGCKCDSACKDAISACPVDAISA
tara:strand:+ start:699 stop:869 length:171 start_codon:yes stop_codon:yes gene_type:complete